MFTGIIEDIGSIEKIEHCNGDMRLTVFSSGLDFKDIKLGDSISTSGVCLTVIHVENKKYIADVSNESLRVTTLERIKVGDEVNLEKALRLKDRLGGHIVSGHVDAIAKVSNIKSEGRSWHYKFTVPENIKKYISNKGSVCIDGISLTVNKVKGNDFYVNIVPHTKDMTTIKNLSLGSEVNIEVDLLSRYLERLLDNSDNSDKKITKQLLKNNGII